MSKIRQANLLDKADDRFKINFVNPNPGTDQPDQPEPDTPGVVTDSAITVQ